MIVPQELSTRDKIVHVLGLVHKSLDYELSPKWKAPWEHGIKDLYQQRDHLLRQLRGYRR